MSLVKDIQVPVNGTERIGAPRFHHERCVCAGVIELNTLANDILIPSLPSVQQQAAGIFIMLRLPWLYIACSCRLASGVCTMQGVWCHEHAMTVP